MPTKREVRDALMKQGAREQWRLRLRDRFWVLVLILVLVALSVAVGYLLAKESARANAKREQAKTLQSIESDVDGLQEAVGELADPYGPFVVQCTDGQMTGLQVFEDGTAVAICSAMPLVGSNGK